MDKLKEAGVLIMSFTFDGPAVNILLLKKLGASFNDLDNIKSDINIEGHENVNVV